MPPGAWAQCMGWGGSARIESACFFVAGSQDDISGYEKGTKAIYLGAIHADRYLLTYQNARHNVATNPPPPESLQPGLHFDEYYRYADPVWNEARINNINQHFVTAFLGIHLKHRDFGKYLELQENANEKHGLDLNHVRQQDLNCYTHCLPNSNSKMNIDEGH